MTQRAEYPQDFHFEPLQAPKETTIIGLRFINDVDMEFLIHWPDNSLDWFHEDYCPCPNQIPIFFSRFKRTMKLLVPDQ